MGTIRVVIVKVFAENSNQMCFVQHDNVIKTFSSDRADDALGVSVLPRGVRRRQYFLDSQISNATAKRCGSINRLEIVGLTVGVFPDRDIQMTHTPLQGLVVRGEQHVEMVAFDRAATIQDRHDVVIVIAGNREH